MRCLLLGCRWRPFVVFRLPAQIPMEQCQRCARVRKVGPETALEFVRRLFRR